MGVNFGGRREREEKKKKKTDTGSKGIWPLSDLDQGTVCGSASHRWMTTLITND